MSKNISSSDISLLNSLSKIDLDDKLRDGIVEVLDFVSVLFSINLIDEYLPKYQVNDYPLTLRADEPVKSEYSPEDLLSSGVVVDNYLVVPRVL